MTDDRPSHSAPPLRRRRKPRFARVAAVVRWSVAALFAIALLLLALRACNVRNGPPLQLWHTYVPPELSAAQIDRADWQTWLAHENALFADVRANVTDRLPPSANKRPSYSPEEMRDLLHYAQCMRQHGYPDWPDPQADGTFQLPASVKAEGKSPRRIAAGQACDQYLHGKGIGVRK